MDGVVREVYKLTQGRGLKMIDRDQRDQRLVKYFFTEDTALMAETSVQLRAQ